MAKKTIVETFDDLSGDRIDTSLVQTPTMTFALDGVEYEIDLGSKNRDALRAALEPYIEAGRKVGSRRGARKGSTASNGASGLAKDELARIRQWAQETGRNVSARGRLPKDLIESYRKENS